MMLIHGGNLPRHIALQLAEPSRFSLARSSDPLEYSHFSHGIVKGQCGFTVLLAKLLVLMFIIGRKKVTDP